MTAPEIGIISALSLAVAASAALAVVVYPVACIAVLGFLSAAMVDEACRAVRR